MARADQRSELPGNNPSHATTPVGPTFRSGVSEASATAPGLEYERFFAKDGVDPFDEIEWDLRSAVIGSEKGEVVFEQAAGLGQAAGFGHHQVDQGAEGPPAS